MRRKVFIVDFDSTIITQESLDLYAKYMGKEQEIATITNLAMNGDMSFRESFSRRIEKLGITRESLDSFIEYAYQPEITEGFAEFVETAKAQGHKVIIVSGGILQLILPALSRNNISVHGIQCNRLEFDEEGKAYIVDRPMLYPKGKCKEVSAIILQYGNDYQYITIGDGVTDMETQEMENVKFYGFMGNVTRFKVMENAKELAYSWDYLISNELS